MREGYHITLTDGVTRRTFKAAIKDQDKAIKAVCAECQNPTDLFVLPLKDGERADLGLGDGQVVEVT